MHRYSRSYSRCRSCAYRRKKKHISVFPYALCFCIVLFLIFILPEWLLFMLAGAFAGAIVCLLCCKN